MVKTKYFSIDLNSRVLSKRIIEAKHLLWKEGGSPAIDAESYNRYQHLFNRIEIISDKRMFEASKETFDTNRKIINFGYGSQYVLPRSYWTITEKQKTLFDEHNRTTNPVREGATGQRPI